MERGLNIYTSPEGFKVEDLGDLSTSNIHGISLDHIRLRHLPSFRPSEIVVSKELHGIRVLEVNIEGRQLCCKTIPPRSAGIERELEVMQRMHNIDRRLRVP